MDAKKTFLAGVTLAGLSSVAFAAPLTAPLTFVGIAPCRIIDTRTSQPFTGAFGPPSLVANASRMFQITGTTTGTPIQCGIPDTAAAISVNFTVTGFAAQGDIRVFPAGSSAPLASILNYQLENIANATTVPLGPSGSGHNGIMVIADAAVTDFIADVNGYYLPATAASTGTNMVGTWAVDFMTTAAGQFAFPSTSFPHRLAAAPAAPLVNIIGVGGGAATANCPGTAANPLAAAGQLCVYSQHCTNGTFQCIAGGGAFICGVSDPFGFFISLSSTAAGAVTCAGTWAVTAP